MVEFLCTAPRQVAPSSLSGSLGHRLPVSSELCNNNLSQPGVQQQVGFYRGLSKVAQGCVYCTLACLYFKCMFGYGLAVLYSSSSLLSWKNAASEGRCSHSNKTWCALQDVTVWFVILLFHGIWLWIDIASFLCAECDPGHYEVVYLSGNTTCEPCPIGSYKTTVGGEACTSCREGTSTEDFGATSSAQCGEWQVWN